MRTYRTKRGPFTERPFYCASMVEDMCETELHSVGLLPQSPEPIRIDRFIEKRFKITPEYAQLPSGILGLTKFGPKGAYALVVSSCFDDDLTVANERRLRATFAHEGGHIMMHGHLFGAVGQVRELFDKDDSGPRVLCRDDSIGSTYNGHWWEYQANMAIGGLLMPRTLVQKASAPFLVNVGNMGVSVLQDEEEAAQALANVFNVNPVVARIRLSQLFPKVEGQLLL